MVEDRVIAEHLTALLTPTIKSLEDVKPGKLAGKMGVVINKRDTVARGNLVSGKSSVPRTLVLKTIC